MPGGVGGGISSLYLGPPPTWHLGLGSGEREKERRGLNEGGCLKSYEARLTGQYTQKGVLEVPGG